MSFFNHRAKMPQTKIHSVYPAPVRDANSPFDYSTATGGTHTTGADVTQMPWYRQDYPFKEYSRLSDFPRIDSRRSLPPHLLPKEYGFSPEMYMTRWKMLHDNPSLRGMSDSEIYPLLTGDGVMTSKMLRTLLTIPGTRIVHSRGKSYSHTSGDIDHIVFNGTRIVLVQSRHWSEGDYWWKDASTVIRYANGKTTELYTDFSESFEDFRDTYKGADVRAAVIVHSKQGEAQVFRNTYPETEGSSMMRPVFTPLVTPGEFFSDFGPWLAAGANGNVRPDLSAFMGW